MLMATGLCKGTKYADPSLCAPRSVYLHFDYGDLLRILAWMDVGKREVREELLSRKRMKDANDKEVLYA